MARDDAYPLGPCPSSSNSWLDCKEGCRLGWCNSLAARQASLIRGLTAHDLQYIPCSELECLLCRGQVRVRCIQ